MDYLGILYLIVIALCVLCTYMAWMLSRLSDAMRDAWVHIRDLTLALPAEDKQ